MAYPFQKPLIIAGPCSAESEEQMLATGNALKSHQNILLEQAFGSLEQDQIALRELEAWIKMVKNRKRRNWISYNNRSC